MRTMAMALVALLASAGACVATPSRRVVHRVLPCGRFDVEATSVVALPGDNMADDVLSQSVRLTDLSTRRTVAIGAPQHLSPDSNVGGRPALDMPAYDMACFRLRTGEDFVTLHYTCTNPDATTCPRPEDWHPGRGPPLRPKEEAWTYDASGQVVPDADAPGRAGAEYRRLRALGLFPAFLPRGVELLWSRGDGKGGLQ